MINKRRTVTRRVAFKTPSGKVEIWENSDGEVLELFYEGRKLQDIKKAEQCFDTMVKQYRQAGSQILASRQALDESAAFAA